MVYIYFRAGVNMLVSENLFILLRKKIFELNDKPVRAWV